MTQQTDKQVLAAAAAIANARGNRRGVPKISNILDALPGKLRDEVMEDARAALNAVEGIRAKAFSGSIDALKEVARLQAHLRRIEDVTNTDAEHDSDYGAVVETVNELARKALHGKE